jgi:hypothetical protein
MAAPQLPSYSGGSSGLETLVQALMRQRALKRAAGLQSPKQEVAQGLSNATQNMDPDSLQPSGVSGPR